MHKVAVIGMPGSGKTKALNLFKQLGAIRINLDEVARDLLEQGTVEYKVVVETFGKGILLDSGDIDRRKLRTKITHDKSSRAILNEIMFPSIDMEYKQRIASLPEASTVAVEIPLMENNDDGYFDDVVLVVADKAVKIDRIMKRDNCSAHDANALINLHPSDKERRKFATFVLDNS